jgi:hypothetical protein
MSDPTQTPAAPARAPALTLADAQAAWFAVLADMTQDQRTRTIYALDDLIPLGLELVEADVVHPLAQKVPFIGSALEGMVDNYLGEEEPKVLALLVPPAGVVAATA